MRSLDVLLVRHPETLANVSGALVGRGHSPYTPEGYRQLKRVPRKICRFAPDSIHSSPLERAGRLASAAARRCHVPLGFDERLMELDFGDAEGLTFEQAIEAGLALDYRSVSQPVAPGGESRGDLERRAGRVCDELRRAGGRHVVVTHGGVFRACMVDLLGLASTSIWAFHIDNAQMAHVRVMDGHGMLESYVQG